LLAQEPALTFDFFAMSPRNDCRGVVLGSPNPPVQSSVFSLLTGAHDPQKRILYSALVPHYRIAQAATLLGISDDTVRRWIDSGRLRASGDSGPVTIDGAELAAHAQEIASAPELGTPVAESARNRFTGLVTRVIKDSVMAQVDIQCGPFRVVSLMSAEAATELQLEPGVLAVASVKSTHVVVEVPADL
jgi:molybdopterin-binding protein